MNKVEIMSHKPWPKWQSRSRNERKSQKNLSYNVTRHFVHSCCSYDCHLSLLLLKWSWVVGSCIEWICGYVIVMFMNLSRFEVVCSLILLYYFELQVKIDIIESFEVINGKNYSRILKNNLVRNDFYLNFKVIFDYLD